VLAIRTLFIMGFMEAAEGNDHIQVGNGVTIVDGKPDIIKGLRVVIADILNWLGIPIKLVGPLIKLAPSL
jgi:hypothetical protein